MKIDYTEVDDYDPTKLNRVKLRSGGLGRGGGLGPYVSPAIRETSLFDHTCDEVDMSGPSFTLESETDFPALGGSGR
jgi:hypothetical protein